MPHHHPPSLLREHARLDALQPRLWRGGLAVGVLMLAASLLLGLGRGDGLSRFAHSYLVSYAYFLSLSLGALFFVAIQHVTRASWSVTVRRLGELVAAAMPALALLAVPILLLLPVLYPWAAPGALRDEIIRHKSGYLNPTFFVLRWAAYLAIWCWAALWYWRRSVGQDAVEDPAQTVRLQRRSGPILVVYAVTVTLASIDLLMSLAPAWFSTIFGVYFFSGGVVGFFALLTALALLLRRSGRLTRVVTIEHMHDLGKLMFAFVFFWAYIAFSQYMLVWFANIPEETIWFLPRQSGGWSAVGLVLIFGHFLLPFLGLVSRYAKRHRALLGLWAAWILLMHWVDLYWLVMPEISPAGPPLALLDLTCLLGVGGIWLATIALVAGQRSLVPTKDPRLNEALTFENA